ncbi:MAG TPA: Ni/Fe hydrogenase subunit gamma [Calditrichae bacterium]|nr:Ni/Fe hydrogenase subunit gamma [Calditrichia bacterium]
MAALPDPMVPIPYRIERYRKETHDTFTLELRPASDQSLPPFRAGQFNMLYVYGVGEVPISISGNPENGEVIVHTTRAVGTVTSAMQHLKAGHVIGMRGPFGSTWPIEEAKGQDVVIVAGGIGLAPLRPVIYYLLNHREKFGKVVILYGARTPEDILYRKEIESWRKRLDMEVLVTVDRATGNWRGNVGVVTRLIPRAPFDPYAAVAMVCGPEIMMYYTVLELMDQGIPKSSIYVSMERNMKCAVGFCGHCQYGPHFICKDGPVFPYERIENLFTKREI